MASMLARQVHFARSANLRQLTCRSFARSAPALKKRGAAASSVDADDLFAPEGEEEELFPSTFGRSEPSPSSSKSTSAFQKPFATRKSKAEYKSAFEKFDEHYAFVMDRLGPRPSAVHPLVRNSAIRRLLHHSREAEHLERVMQALVLWRNNGRVVDCQTATELIDRFLAWSPSLLLPLLTDKVKYGVTIPSMSDARRIMHRLVLFRPHPIAQSTDIAEKKIANAESLRNCATFAALMPAHGLREATKDLVCCALLAQACARNLLFAEVLDAKGKLGEGEGEGGGDAASLPPKKRAPLGAASTRGLLSISSILASLLSTPSPSPAPTDSSSPSPSLSSSPSIHHLPTPEYITTLAKRYVADPFAGSISLRNNTPEEGLYTPRVGTTRPVKFQKRVSGVTQTRLEEMVWAWSAVRDVVRALRLEGVEGSSKKKTLEVLEVVLQNSLRKEDAEKTQTHTTSVHPMRAFVS